MPQKLRNAAINIGLAIFSVALFVALGEGVSRLVWSAERTGNCYKEDPLFVHRLQSHCTFRVKEPEGQLVSMQINECGLRGNHRCSPRQPQTFRIFTIGDSFTFGALVPEESTYPRIMEQSLQTHSPHPIEVFNGGVEGYDLFHYLLKLKEAIGHDPQLVTIGLLPNDLYPELSEESISKRIELIKKLGGKKANDKLNEEYQGSFLTRLKTLVFSSRSAFAFAHTLMSNEKIYLQSYLLRKGTEDSYLKVQYSDLWNRKIQQANRILKKMARQAQKRKTQLAIVLIPHRVQAILLNHQDETLDPFAFSKKIQGIAAQLNIPVIDFLEALRDHPNPGELYFPVDGHLTPEGQRLLGQYMTQQLVNRNLVPSSVAQKN